MEAARPRARSPDPEDDIDAMLRAGAPSSELEPEPEELLPGSMPARTRSPDPGDLPQQQAPPSQFAEAAGLAGTDGELGGRGAVVDLSAGELTAIVDGAPGGYAPSAAAAAATFTSAPTAWAAAEAAEEASQGGVFADLLAMPPPDAEGALLDIEMRLQRVHEIEEQLRSEAINDYLSAFDQAGSELKLTIGQIPAADIDALRSNVDAEQAEYRNKTVSLQHKRQQHLIDSREKARQKVWAEHVKLAAATRQVEMELVTKERKLLRRLATRFRSNEERLRVLLEGRQAEVQLADGNIKQQGRRYTMHDRAYSVEWSRAPQPVALHLKCLRAVRDKVTAPPIPTTCTARFTARVSD